MHLGTYEVLVLVTNLVYMQNTVSCSCSVCGPVSHPRDDFLFFTGPQLLFKHNKSRESVVLPICMYASYARRLPRRGAPMSGSLWPVGHLQLQAGHFDLVSYAPKVVALF